MLLAYSLGFCVWASASPGPAAAGLGARSPSRARRAARRRGRRVTWVLGEAPLRYYLSTGAFQVRPADGYDWLVHEIDFVSDGKVPPPPRRLLGPGFRETAREAAGQPLHPPLPSCRGPGLAPLRLRELRDARLDFRNNGVLLDGVGPG